MQSAICILGCGSQIKRESVEFRYFVTLIGNHSESFCIRMDFHSINIYMNVDQMK